MNYILDWPKLNKYVHWMDNDPFHWRRDYHEPFIYARDDHNGKLTLFRSDNQKVFGWCQLTKPVKENMIIGRLNKNIKLKGGKPYARNYKWI